MQKIQIGHFKRGSEKTALLLATALGAGFTPKAPGTAGTVVGIPIVYLLLTYSVPLYAQLLFWIFLTLLGTWATRTVLRITQSPDHQSVVIDEVIGFGICSLCLNEGSFHPQSSSYWLGMGVAFLLFRLFDIIKLPPVRQVDRWSKHSKNTWFGAFGVIADDLLAGIQGLGVLLLLQYFEVF